MIIDPNSSYENLKDIPTWTQWAVILAGMWGAVMNFLSRKVLGESFKTRMTWFLVDSVASFGLTALAFLTLIGWGSNEVFAVGVSGFFGHMGTRGIHIAQLAVLEKFGAKQTFNHIKDETNESFK